MLRRLLVVLDPYGNDNDGSSGYECPEEEPDLTNASPLGPGAVSVATCFAIFPVGLLATIL